MTGERAERFIVLNLRLLAVSFGVVGILFIAIPNGVLEALDDVGAWLPLGSFSPAPPSAEKLWLGLGFAYMVVITGICVVVSTDVVRYRPLLLVLAAGKAASSLTTLGFYLGSDDVFAYLANFVVDGYLVVASLWLWSLSARVGRPAAPS